MFYYLFFFSLGVGRQNWAWSFWPHSCSSAQSAGVEPATIRRAGPPDAGYLLTTACTANALYGEWTLFLQTMLNLQGNEEAQY